MLDVVVLFAALVVKTMYSVWILFTNEILPLRRTLIVTTFRSRLIAYYFQSIPTSDTTTTP
jgi:hypothetical protein